MMEVLMLCLAGLVFDGGPRMNQIQVVGTHNSYHKRSPGLEVAAMVTPEARDWDYEHKPLDAQLDNGVRSFELDIHRTPEGWRVFHVPFVDEQSTCRMFADCLAVVRAWSDAHPGHVPISFLVEHKDEGPVLDPAITLPTAADLDRLDAEVRAAFPPDRLITPDDVRGDFATLEEAVLQRGWPTLESGRGKVFFIFHETRELRDLYADGRPSLQGRAMFVNSRPGRPDAAAMIRDNPADPDTPDLVRRGYWVRATAGGPGTRGLEAAKARLERAFACGAQIVSSDYPPGEPHAETGYVVALPGGGPARWNPVNPPADTSTSPEPAR
ncbi:MAG TPA: Ca2+-dependent phosphoinositide-specific phospholipase C [Candidatus Hydrogenedentes bacterium]|nr:Ca2+-dependent phosphoinositide-specific phospholipase C [Candidatus Hydrogenedentota bacterium]HRZ83008.1 Ca2+-dependent phosphoinositide-specific phospholipase C [Candidatus Hydrogenedentota bacterium]